MEKCLNCNKKLGENEKDFPKGTLQRKNEFGKGLMTFCSRDCSEVFEGLSFEEKKQRVLNKIFITPKEVMEMREKELEEKKKYYTDLERTYKEITERFGDFEKIFGEVIRGFELKEGVSLNEKKVLDRLWEYILKEVLKKYKIPQTLAEKRKRLDIRTERHLESLRKIKQEKKRLTKKDKR